MSKRVLYLSVKKKWFDMIASGEKKEEYRETTKYWSSRFFPYNQHVLVEELRDIKELLKLGVKKNIYTHIVFINGRNPKVNRTLEKEIESIEKGYPKDEWCPEEMRNKVCWIIKLK